MTMQIIILTLSERNTFTCDERMHTHVKMIDRMEQQPCRKQLSVVVDTCDETGTHNTYNTHTHTHTHTHKTHTHVYMYIFSSLSDSFSLISL